LPLQFYILAMIRMDTFSPMARIQLCDYTAVNRAKIITLSYNCLAQS